MFEGEQKTKLVRFLRRTVYGDPKNPCTEIVLKPLDAMKKRGTEIYSIEVDTPDKISHDDIELWTQDIGQIAFDDAEGLGNGHQRYVILPYHGKIQKGRYGFSVSIDSSPDEDSLSTEPPSMTGLTNQLMRHNEAIMKTSVGAMNHVLSQYSKQLEIVTGQNEKLLSTHVEMLTVIEELKNEQHERNLEVRQEEFKQHLKEEGFKDIKALAPALINKMVGRKLLPESTDTMSMAVKTFGESLRAEQIQELSKILTPPQQVAFFQLYEAIRNDKETVSSGNGIDSGVSSDAD